MGGGAQSGATDQAGKGWKGDGTGRRAGAVCSQFFRPSAVPPFHNPAPAHLSRWAGTGRPAASAARWPTCRSAAPPAPPARPRCPPPAAPRWQQVAVHPAAQLLPSAAHQLPAVPPHRCCAAPPRSPGACHHRRRRAAATPAPAAAVGSGDTLRAPGAVVDPCLACWCLQSGCWPVQGPTRPSSLPACRSAARRGFGSGALSSRSQGQVLSTARKYLQGEPSHQGVLPMPLSRAPLPIVASPPIVYHCYQLVSPHMAPGRCSVSHCVA